MLDQRRPLALLDPGDRAERDDLALVDEIGNDDGAVTRGRFREHVDLAALQGEALTQLIASIQHEVPDFRFVEMFDGEHRTQLSTATSDGVARISRRHLPDALPSLLMFELARRP